MALDERILAAVQAHDQTRRGLVTKLQQLLRQMLATMRDGAAFDRAKTAEYARAAAAAASEAQKLEAAAAGVYLRDVVTVLHGDPGQLLVQLPRQPRGVDPLVVAERPLATYRRLQVVDGLDELQAFAEAETRALLLADGDVSLGMREGSRQALEGMDGVQGYRRVLRPELTASGPCGLCAVASDRIYKASELLPIHTRCVCLTLPVMRVDGVTYDPGDSLNAEDLAQLYRDAGSTTAADLKRIRIAVRQHGELGPVLVNAEHRFRGPDDVPPPADPAAANPAA